MELAQTSKRMANRVKFGGNNFKLSLTATTTYSALVVTNGTVSDIIHILRENIIGPSRIYDSYEVNVDFAFHAGRKIAFKIYWDSDVQEGLYVMAKYLCGLFDCSFNALIWRSSNLRLMQRITDLIIARQTEIGVKEIEQFEVHGNTLDEEAVQGILDKLKVTETLKIELTTPASRAQFQHTFDYAPKLVVLRHCPLLTFENLVNLDIQRVHLKTSDFTNYQIDVIVKKWKAGGFPNLKCIEVTSNLYSQQVPVAGLLPRIENQEPQGLLQFKTIGNSPFNKYDGQIIYKNDGASGRIFMGTGQNATFFLYVDGGDVDSDSD
ncbi:hypothetical protein CAEBREN_00388 [Caenorhabditis brenneri]|uniref:Sdz-33 F-box domain-containing protein n=1 Tax=Caenorhabditis brenneri TaxID=135651 RepID=G0NIJ6_CAEBE|nr:hypothetical protein CAEBREN_00388 [Caenorhabditis brenneri]